MSRATSFAGLVYNPAGGEESQVTLSGNSRVTVMACERGDPDGGVRVAALGHGKVKVNAKDNSRIFVGLTETDTLPSEKAVWTTLKGWFYDLPDKNFNKLVTSLKDVRSLSMIKDIRESDLNDLSPILRRALMKFISSLKEVDVKRFENAQDRNSKCINQSDESHHNKATSIQEEETEATSSVFSPSDDINVSGETKPVLVKVDFRTTMQNWFKQMHTEDLNKLIELLERRDICSVSMLKEVQVSDLNGISFDKQERLMKLVVSLKEADLETSKVFQKLNMEDSLQGDVLSDNANENAEAATKKMQAAEASRANSKGEISTFYGSEEQDLKAAPIREGGTEAEHGDKTSEDSRLRTFLKREFQTLPTEKFEELLEALKKIGVYGISDLKMVEESDLENLLPTVQKRKLMKIIERLRDQT